MINTITWNTSNLNLYQTDNVETGGSDKDFDRPSFHKLDDKGSMIVFDDIERTLVSLIEEADLVVGCVAWLTSKDILKALSEKYCQIVVQKEDFLRPDEATTNKKLSDLYNKLKTLDRFQLPGIADKLSYCADPTTDPIRCAGNHNSNKKAAHPRMHHKFLVFLKATTWTEQIEESITFDGTTHPAYETECRRYDPYGVWTGSYNMSYNASQSLENGIFLRQKEAAEAYALEWSHIFSISEPLDWTSEWCAPEYRIGS